MRDKGWFYLWYCRDEKTWAKAFNFWEVHHAFWGIIGIIWGFYLLFWGLPMWIIWTMEIMSFWLLLDDLYQHAIQRKQIEENELKYNERFYTCHSFWNWYPRRILRAIKKALSI